MTTVDQRGSPMADQIAVERGARLRWAMLLTLALAACSPTRGCIESSFTLAPESRLPKWFASTGVPRSDAIVTMDYWIGPSGATATFVLRDSRGRAFARVVGEVQGKGPVSLKPRDPTDPIGYPLYEVITVDGVVDVIEHRRMEPVFYVTDDPVVWSKLGGHD